MQKVLIALLVLALGSAFLWGVHRDRDREGTVRVGYPPLVTAFPLFIAEDAESFAESHVKLESNAVCKQQ